MELADDPGRLEDRAAALLRLDPGVCRTPVDDDPQVEDPLARRHDVAVGARALEHERDVAVGRHLADVRGRGRRADLLVRVGDEDEALERQAAALGDDRLERVQARQQAGLHVGHARAVGDAVVDAERPLGGGARIEDRVHVADQQDARAVRPAVEGGDQRGAQAAGGVRPVLDLGAQIGEERRHPAPDRVDAGRRVAPAIDVDEARQVDQVGRHVGTDHGRAGRRARRPTGSEASRSRRSSAQSSGWHLAILPGPCVWSRPASSKARTSTGSSRWSSSRSPSAGGGPGTGSAIPGRHALVHLGAAVPTRDWPDGVAATAAWIRRLRADHGEGRGGLAVHRSSDPGHWIVTFPWVGAERALTLTEAALALAERDVSPSRTARLTGAQERLLARWTERIAAARATPPEWLRDADRRVPIVSISGTNGKSTVTRLITHVLLRAGRHVGTTTSDGVLVDERMVEPGDWTGPGGAHQILARRDIDVASSRRRAAGSSCAVSATSRTMRAC